MACETRRRYVQAFVRAKRKMKCGNRRFDGGEAFLSAVLEDSIYGPRTVAYIHCAVPAERDSCCDPEIPGNDCAGFAAIDAVDCPLRSIRYVHLATGSKCDPGRIEHLDGQLVEITVGFETKQGLGQLLTP